MSASEAALIEACRRGDEAAWASVYASQRASVSRFLRRCVGPHVELDDLVQKVFLEAFTSLHRFRGCSKLSTWLYRIANNVAAKEARSQGRYRRRLQALTLHEDQCRRASSDAHGRAEARQAIDALDTVLAGLNHKRG